jgi:ribosomal protein S18 acetylase RimI-like enzyme
MTELEQAIAFSRAFDERRAERIVPAPHGRALLTPSLPLVRHRNHFSVDLGADVSANEITAEAEPIFLEAGLAHRKVTIDDDLGGRVAPDFRERGWKVEELVMPLRRPGEYVDTSRVEEVDPHELEPLWIQGMRSEIEDNEEIRQLVAAQHGRRRGAKVRYFAARVEGEIASYCELFLERSDDNVDAVARPRRGVKGEQRRVTRDLRIGRRRAWPSVRPIGQIESVMTLEPYRNRGLAKAVVARARDESIAAGTDLTFIVAAADDWPKELYRKLGFETAGRMWDFVLMPG